MEPHPPMKRKSICDPSAWKEQVIRISSTSGGHSKRIEQHFRFRRSASRSSSPLSEVDESNKSSSPNLNNPTGNRASATVQPTAHLSSATGTVPQTTVPQITTGLFAKDPSTLPPTSSNHSAPGGPAPRARDSANAQGWKGAFLCFNTICFV
jgi:hypothetical protein